MADAFFHLIICRFVIPTVMHSDQGSEFENHLMQNCASCYGLIRLAQHVVIRLAMDQWKDLIERYICCWPCSRGSIGITGMISMMMAYRSSVHESTGFSPYRLMFGEECTLPLDVGVAPSYSRLTRSY